MGDRWQARGYQGRARGRYDCCRGGCAGRVPRAFGTSALKPTGNIPPEFAEFNNFDPQANAVVADQVCALPYTLLTEKSLRASPGEIVAWSGRCEQYEIRLDNLAEHFSP